MQVWEVYELLNRLAPFDTAEAWDNVGILVGGGKQEVAGILTTLDVTLSVIEEAAQTGCSLIVSHHPIIFSPLKRVTAGEPVYEAARRGLSVISAHTNLDVAKGGVNSCLAQRLGLVGVTPLDEAEERYMGCLGRLPRPMAPKELGDYIASVLGLAPRYNPLGSSPIIYLGLCGGSGAELLLEAATPPGCQAFLTADVKHHQFIEAAQRGITLYDGGHYATEAVVLPELTQRLQAAFPGVSVRQAKRYGGELRG